MPLLLVLGCQHVAQQDDLTGWLQQRNWAEQINAFEFEGRIATPAGSARIHWRQFADERVDILLSGPLGQGATRVFGNLQEVRIVNAQGERRGPPATLLKESFALDMPLGDFARWALGVPGPSAVWAVDGRSFKQGDWQVEIERVLPVAELRWLPGKIRIEHLGPTPYRVVLIADRWNLEPPP